VLGILRKMKGLGFSTHSPANGAIHQAGSPMFSETMREYLLIRGQRIVSSSIAYFIALLLLCGAYLQGGITKVLNFDGAVSEARNFGLEPAGLVAVATIVTELGGAALVLSGILRWLGALWLAGFTLLATFVANRFWELAMPERLAVENSFFEHLGLIGGFLLVAWIDLKKGTAARGKAV
jgi:uncharacterized membrane protein YphA (DoxX/SURF4 family)